MLKIRLYIWGITVLAGVATLLNWLSLIHRGKFYVIASLFFPLVFFLSLALQIDGNAFNFTSSKFSVKSLVSFLTIGLGFIASIVNLYLMFNY